MSVDTRLDDQRIDMSVLLGALLSRWLRVLVVTILALGTTFAILQFVPKLYESSASILVELRAGAAATPSQPSIPVEAMMSSQIELIKSRDTLLSVIDSENLRAEPEFTGVSFSPVGFVMQLLGRPPADPGIDETVMGNLYDRLTVVRERDSAVISILVRSTSPELAARIANAIAEAHVRRRSDLTLSDTAEASVWLAQEIARLRVKVEEAERAVADYRVENDLLPTGGSNSVLDTQLASIATQITAAQERKNAAQSRANLIRELLASGRPIDGVEDVRNSVVIQQLSQTRATLQGELAQRSSTLLGNHPTIRALRAQIAEIEQQIAREGRNVAGALESQAQIEGNVEASLREDLARLKQSASTVTRDTVALDSLEREAKAQRDLLESYLLRYSDASSRATAGSALPDVRVITVAAPAQSPASPKTTFVLGAVGFVALALQIGAILFGELMSGRALTAPAGAFAGRRAEAPAVDAPLPEPVPAEPVPAETVDYDNDVQFVDADEPNEHVWPDAEPVAAVEEEAVAEPEPPAPEPVAVAQTVTDGWQEDGSYRDQFEIAPGLPLTDDEGARDEPAVPETADEPEDAAGDGLFELDNLSADIALGRVRRVMLSALDSNHDSDRIADLLIDDALARGLSVALVDAGSQHLSSEPGITDLAVGAASFGDVVHRVREGLAHVPWGQQLQFDHRSERPATLLEALGDIYEVVIVTTGRMGPRSALPAFADLPARLVLVGADRPAREMVEAAVETASGMGFEIDQIVRATRRTEVA